MCQGPAPLPAEAIGVPVLTAPALVPVHVPVQGAEERDVRPRISTTRIYGYRDCAENRKIWERENGFQTATKRCSVLKDADLSQIDLFHLQKWVYKDDLPTFNIFLDQLKAAMDGKPCGIAPDEEKVTVAVRLLSENDTYIY